MIAWRSLRQRCSPALRIPPTPWRKHYTTRPATKLPASLEHRAHSSGSIHCQRDCWRCPVSSNSRMGMGTTCSPKAPLRQLPRCAESRKSLNRSRQWHSGDCEYLVLLEREYPKANFLPHNRTSPLSFLVLSASKIRFVHPSRMPF